MSGRIQVAVVVLIMRVSITTFFLCDQCIYYSLRVETIKDNGSYLILQKLAKDSTSKNRGNPLSHYFLRFNYSKFGIIQNATYHSVYTFDIKVIKILQFFVSNYIDLKL